MNPHVTRSHMAIDDSNLESRATSWGVNQVAWDSCGGRRAKKRVITREVWPDLVSFHAT